jgi:hypothetical protein
MAAAAAEDEVGEAEEGDRRQTAVRLRDLRARFEAANRMAVSGVGAGL